MHFGHSAYLKTLKPKLSIQSINIKKNKKPAKGKPTSLYGPVLVFFFKECWDFMIIAP